MSSIIEWILHVDRHLAELMEAIGPGWLYLVLAAIIFCETGLVVMPFLPGDSLLFAVGALCAIDNSPLQIWVMIPLLCVAAIAGDAVNYWIGNYIGPRVFKSDTSRWFNKAHLLRAQAFYDRYGAKAIVLARFVPIVRTFAPFVAGIGKMNFFRFWFYNIVGGVIWVTVFLVAGYWMGRWEIVQKNFFLVTIGIIIVSILPVAWEWYQARRESKQPRN
ncbi:MAG: DedA family protein [Pirellula sp.]|jgi:membrane-associated protein|nr:DedA family protein [Pirellula sp.]